MTRLYIIGIGILLSGMGVTLSVVMGNACSAIWALSSLTLWCVIYYNEEA